VSRSTARSLKSEAHALADKTIDTLAPKKVQKQARKQVADARKTVRGARRETARRTGAARDALAGRRPRRNWSAFLAFAGVGAALGAISARMAKRGPDAELPDGSDAN
jgi:hypothetical protein